MRIYIAVVQMTANNIVLILDNGIVIILSEHRL